MVADTPVFIAKSFHVENIGKADLMSRVVEIGIYNTMFDRCNDYTRYTSDSRKLRVYNNDIDSWSDIEFAYALYNCGIWTANGDLTDVFNVGKNRSHTAAADDEHDFLSHIVGGKRTNISYIGDMDPEYITEQDLLDGGQTLLNALAYNDPVQARELMESLSKAAEWKEDRGLSPDEQTKQNKLMSRIKNLVGAKNLFTKAGAANLTDFSGSYFAAALKTGTNRGGATLANQQPVQSSINDMDTIFLRDAMGAALSNAYREQVEEIASASHIDWKERAQSIKGLVLEAIESDPSSVTSLRNAQDVDAWHQSNVSGFARKRAQQAAQQGGAQEQSSSERKYFSTQAPLPAGWKWEQPELVNAPVLARIPAFQALFANSNDQQAPRTGGRGRAARIGAEYAQPANSASQAIIGALAPNSQYHNLARHIDAISASSAHPAIKMLAIIYAGSEFKRDRLVSYARKHIAVKLGLLLLRPHCTYRTQYGIKCLSGGGSGYTFFGHSNMQIEHEAARKVGMMHYTAYLSAVVLYPKNVYVVEDIYCEKYLGGMGVEFWQAVDYAAGTMKRNAKSIICVPLPPSTKQIEQKIDARGRWYTENSLHLVAQERFNKPHFPGAGRINRLFKLYDPARKDRNISRGRVAVNYVCWQGMQFFFNDTTKKFDDYIVESGCMGPKVYPGCGLVRNGKLKLLKDPNYEGVR